jgi:hypothetical protein
MCWFRSSTKREQMGAFLILGSAKYRPMPKKPVLPTLESLRMLFCPMSQWDATVQIWGEMAALEEEAPWMGVEAVVESRQGLVAQYWALAAPEREAREPGT